MFTPHIRHLAHVCEKVFTSHVLFCRESTVYSALKPKVLMKGWKQWHLKQWGLVARKLWGLAGWNKFVTFSIWKESRFDLRGCFKVLIGQTWHKVAIYKLFWINILVHVWCLKLLSLEARSFMRKLWYVVMLYCML